MAHVLLPHLRDRPLSLLRYPTGITGERFFQKHWEGHRPPFVETVTIYSEHNDADGEYLVCNNLATLVWLGQIANLELHTWFSRTSPEPDGYHLGAEFSGSRRAIESSLLNYPDVVVFDLDPYVYSGKERAGEEPELNRVAFRRTCELAHHLRETLAGLGLAPFVKTTGRTGLHIVVPILRTLDFGATRAAAQTVAEHLHAQYPKLVTTDWAVRQRTGRIFVDFNMNGRGKTVASIYSPRNLPEAAVSVPLAWEELDHVYPTDFTVESVPDRVARIGDLWANLLTSKTDLRSLLKRAA
jgi:bifunctional non-homologous end joining protein LigD